MQFNQITYFLRTCDTLNFTRAAEMCNVSQPSLSSAIQKLEEEIGGELFNRTGRTIVLTPFGESMRVHLSRIESARIAAHNAASMLVQAKSNSINMGFMCTLSPRKLLSAIAKFGRIQPGNELLIHDVWESKALELLLSGALDCIVIAHTSELPDRFETRQLADEKMMLAMHEKHPLAELESINLSDLQGREYVDRLRCEFRESFFEELGKRDLQVQVVLRSEREDLVADSISAAVGISIMPKSAALSAGLKICALGDMEITRKISVVVVKDRQIEPAVHEFIQHICDAYA